MSAAVVLEHQEQTKAGCPKCKARPGNISHAVRRIENGTAIYESTCIQCGWLKDTPVSKEMQRAEPVKRKGPSAADIQGERIYQMTKQAEVAKPEKKKSNKTVRACAECGRMMTIVGRGLCGKCYHYVLKAKIKAEGKTRGTGTDLRKKTVDPVTTQPGAQAVPVVLQPAIQAARQIQKTEPKQVNAVNHPQHHTSHPSGIECIQITEHMGFNLGNALKYIWRADEKGQALQDLEKATWYIQRELARRKGVIA